MSSLNWNIENTRAWKEIDKDKWEEGQWGAISCGVVFGLMSAGMSRLTKDNYKEVRFRWDILDKMGRGTICEYQKDGPPKYRMPNDTESEMFFGATTNVTFEKRSKWLTGLN